MRSWRNLDLLDRAASRGVLLLLLLLPLPPAVSLWGRMVQRNVV